jgi:GNAT superfamily N-acetyltransferase
MKFSQPRPLLPTDPVAGFSSGKPELDDWLARRALKAEGRSARTYVVVAPENVIAGYFCLAASSIEISASPPNVARNMPRQIPVILLGRLAVASRFQGLGLGKSMLRDALVRAAASADIIGARALLIHALDEKSAHYYEALGFLRYPKDSKAFFVPVSTLAKGL